MPKQKTASSSKTTGVVCTVLGGALTLWVVARLSSAAGWQQTWAPPFARYEWVTLVVGAATTAARPTAEWGRTRGVASAPSSAPTASRQVAE
jgi:hypothetical protein